VANGDTAAAIGRAIGRWMPLFPQAVRFHSQIDYSLYGVSPVPDVILAPYNELVERAYLLDWCSRDVAAWRPGAVRWAADIRRMQDLTERRGHRFLYLLTPSKVAQYPFFVPAGFGCPSRPADREQVVPQWREIVQKAGIHFADTTASIADARATYRFPLFPPGGTHLNELGQAIAMQTVMAELDQLVPGHGFSGFGYAWEGNKRAGGDDLDLARLLNLYTSPWAVPVPRVRYSQSPQPSCPAQTLVIVGGSFAHLIGRALSLLPCHPEVTEYEYWHTSRVTWSHGERYETPLTDPAERDAAVAGADTLIYEENEQILRQPDAGRALLVFLQGH
jgi:hypothetical protein